MGRAKVVSARIDQVGVRAGLIPSFVGSCDVTVGRFGAP